MAKVSWLRLTIVLALLTTVAVGYAFAGPDTFVYLEQTTQDGYQGDGVVRIRMFTTDHPDTDVTVFYNTEKNLTGRATKISLSNLKRSEAVLNPAFYKIPGKN